jgi:hypothetical protein
MSSSENNIGLPSLPSLPPKLSLARKSKRKETTQSSSNDTLNPLTQYDEKGGKDNNNMSNKPNNNQSSLSIGENNKEDKIKKNKIGTYASTEFQNWLNTPIQKPKIKRSKKTNDDAFQIFLDFADKTENEDWKAFFNKLYTGKFPHGYSYRNQTLFFRKRTKIEKLDIQDNSNETMNKVMNFFKNYGGFSILSKDTNIFDFLLSKTPIFQSWKDIRSKKTKQFFINKFVDELTQQYQLNKYEKDNLMDTIHSGFLLKSIESCDIEFDNQKITKIKTIHWNPEKRKFDLEIQNRVQKPTRKNTADRVAKNSFLVHWNKFLVQYVKDKPQLDDIPTDASIISVQTDDLTDTSMSLSSFTDN